MIGIATSRMRRRLEAWAAEDPGTAELLERVVRRELDPATAASQLLERQTDALRSPRPPAPTGPRRSAGAALPLRRSASAALGKVDGFFSDALSGEPNLAGCEGCGRRRARVVAVPIRRLRRAAGAGVWAAVDDARMRRRPGGRPDPSAAARARADDMRSLRDQREGRPRSRSRATPERDDTSTAMR